MSDEQSEVKCSGHCPNRARRDGLCLPHWYATRQHLAPSGAQSLQERAEEIMTMGHSAGAAAILELVQEAIDTVERGYEHTIRELNEAYRSGRISDEAHV